MIRILLFALLLLRHLFIKKNFTKRFCQLDIAKSTVDSALEQKLEIVFRKVTRGRRTKLKSACNL